MLGLLTLLVGGDVLVRGSVSLARSLGISSLVIGMTVIGFGTSAPELGVNVMAALGSSPGIGFGNVVGSSLANIGLILGLAAVVVPLKVTAATLRVDMPILVVATAALFVLGLDLLPFRDAAGFGFVDGLILLVGFVGFLAVAARSVMASRQARRTLPPEDRPEPRPAELVKAVVLTVAGLAGVLAGSHWTVEGAVGLARGLGADEAVIGLTVVALGTSLPELATTILALRTREVDLALGNVVGSNIFNILLILGTTAVIRPVPLPAGGLADLVALGACTLGLWLMAATHQRHLLRWEGAVLLATYLGYMAWRASGL